MPLHPRRLFRDWVNQCHVGDVNWAPGAIAAIAPRQQAELLHCDKGRLPRTGLRVPKASKDAEVLAMWNGRAAS